jgi:tetratricopeptide (TPR) repeat protein
MPRQPLQATSAAHKEARREFKSRDREGDRLRSEGHFAEAAKEFSAALDAAIAAGEKPHVVAQARRDIADCQSQDGDPATAYDTLHAALRELAPVRPPAWLQSLISGGGSGGGSGRNRGADGLDAAAAAATTAMAAAEAVTAAGRKGSSSLSAALDALQEWFLTELERQRLRINAVDALVSRAAELMNDDDDERSHDGYALLLPTAVLSLRSDAHQSAADLRRFKQVQWWSYRGCRAGWSYRAACG